MCARRRVCTCMLVCLYVDTRDQLQELPTLFSFLNMYFYFMCISILLACMSIHHVCPWCLWKPEETSESMNGNCGQLWITVWMLGTEPRSSIRAASTFSCWAIAPAPILFGFGFLWLALFFKIRYLSLVSGAHQYSKPGVLTRESHTPTCLHCHSRITSLYDHTQLFSWVLGSQARILLLPYTVSVILTNGSLQPTDLFFKFLHF